MSLEIVNEVTSRDRFQLAKRLDLETYHGTNEYVSLHYIELGKWESRDLCKLFDYAIRLERELENMRGKFDGR